MTVWDCQDCAGDASERRDTSEREMMWHDAPLQMGHYRLPRLPPRRMCTSAVHISPPHTLSDDDSFLFADGFAWGETLEHHLHLGSLAQHLYIRSSPVVF